MPQPQRSASPSETTKTPALRLLPLRLPRRLDELTKEIAVLICDMIKLDGLADHLAGALSGVNRATFERWKAEDEGFAFALETARAEFEWALIRQIRDARKRDGTSDWRAQAWVLKHLTADGIAKPARSAKPAAEAAKNSANRPETPAAPVHEHSANRPEAAGRPPATVPSENAANRPETPAQPDHARQRLAPLEGQMAPVAQQRAA